MVGAGIGHLTFLRQEFQAQVPQWLPGGPEFMDFIVVASGVVEILLGFSLIFLTRHRMAIGITLAAFFILIFPGNIAQYVNGTDAFGLNTDTKRLARLFFQPALIAWALWSTGAWSYLRKRFFNINR